MTTNIEVRRIAVLAYGSLLAHPGEWVGRNMKELVRCETPFGVEYAGQSTTRRFGAPTLVRLENGTRVRGGLIVLPFADTPEWVAEVKRQVSLRETGEPNSKKVKSDVEMFGLCVVYSDFNPNFEKPTPDRLADAAIQSVSKCFENGVPFMNGLRYLFENIEWGVETTLTKEYERNVLEKTSSKCLKDAEFKLLRDACEKMKPTQRADKPYA